MSTAFGLVLFVLSYIAAARSGAVVPGEYTRDVGCPGEVTADGGPWSRRPGAQSSQVGDPFEAAMGFFSSESVATLAQTVKDNAVSNYEALMEKYGDDIQQAATDLAQSIGESGVVEAIANGTFADLCSQYGIKL